MEQFNKALSFILGLVVVAVFIIVASGKFNFKGVNVAKTNTPVAGTPTPKPTSKPWFFFGSKPTVAPTKKPTPTVIPQTISYGNNGAQQQNKQDPNFHPYTSINTPTSIPNTGVPIVLFPLFGTSLLTGIFMKKSGKRD
ncbi:MAG: hypothetical protein NTZ55_03565 [Candidatus Roizmanbacteria bacterium]|nr:hypothetical protein [Candidatus Roizmanbacteria bacterium]